MSVPTVIFNGTVGAQGSLRNISKALAVLYANCQKEWGPSIAISGVVQSDNVPDNMTAKVADALAKVTIAMDDIDQFYEGYVKPNS